MSVDGIQICVGGGAEATVAVRPHSANAARATPNRWMILPLFFMVPSRKMECRAVPGKSISRAIGRRQGRPTWEHLERKREKKAGAAGGEEECRSGDATKLSCFLHRWRDPIPQV